MSRETYEIRAVGELFGGGPAPVVAGHVAERSGIDQLLWLPLAAMVAGFGLCLMLRETRWASHPATRKPHEELVA